MSSRSKHSRVCFIGCIGRKCTDDQLVALLETKIGPVESVIIKKNEEGISKGFALATFENAELAEKCIDVLDDTRFGDKILHIEEYKSKREQNQSGDDKNDAPDAQKPASAPSAEKSKDDKSESDSSDSDSYDSSYSSSSYSPPPRRRRRSHGSHHHHRSSSSADKVDKKSSKSDKKSSKSKSKSDSKHRSSKHHHHHSHHRH